MRSEGAKEVSRVSTSPPSCRTSRRWPFGSSAHHPCSAPTRELRERGAGGVGSVSVEADARIGRVPAPIHPLFLLASRLRAERRRSHLALSRQYRPLGEVNVHRAEVIVAPTHDAYRALVALCQRSAGRPRVRVQRRTVQRSSTWKSKVSPSRYTRWQRSRPPSATFHVRQ